MTLFSRLTDEELVEEVRSADQELYRYVVARYQEKLLRYATYLTGDSDSAKDAVQTAFIKAFQNLRSFDIKKKFSSWLYRIVHNEAMNAIKKHHQAIGLDTDQWHLLPSHHDIEAEYSRKELQTYIRKTLNKLPVEYKAPITLFFLENRSYEEISDILRLPVGTVGTRINRGKARIKQLMES